MLPKNPPPNSECEFGADLEQGAQLAARPARPDNRATHINKPKKSRLEQVHNAIHGTRSARKLHQTIVDRLELRLIKLVREAARLEHAAAAAPAAPPPIAPHLHHHQPPAD